MVLTTLLPADCLLARERILLASLLTACGIACTVLALIYWSLFLAIMATAAIFTAPYLIAWIPALKWSMWSWCSKAQYVVFSFSCSCGAWYSTRAGHDSAIC